MAIIYTNQSSGAIRRAKKRKPTKAYLEALSKHIKYLKKLGFDCDDNGRIKLTTDGRHTIDIVSRMINEEDTHIKSADLIPMSNKLVMVVLNLTIVGRLRQVNNIQLLQRTIKVPIW